jgi:hypothetical protein
MKKEANPKCKGLRK